MRRRKVGGEDVLVTEYLKEYLVRYGKFGWV